MIRTGKFVTGFCLIMGVVLLAGILDCQAQDRQTQHGVSDLFCGRIGQEFLVLGRYDDAIDSLEDCLVVHPESDWLYSMLGRAYFKKGDLEMAEVQFRNALDINKNNPVAKRLIVEVRKTQDLLKDRDMMEWINIAKEKVADLVTLVLGVWLGLLLSSISSKIYSHFVKTNFRKALAKKDFDYATDILEDLVVKREKAQLRKRLMELLDAYPLEDAKELIIEYVDDRDIEDKLVHFLLQVHKKNKYK